MKKHIEVQHNALLKRYVEKISNLLRAPLKCHVATNCPCITLSAIFGFFSSTNQFRKDNDAQVRFLEGVMLYVIKGFLSVRIVEFVWLQHMLYKLCPRVVFPSKEIFWKRFTNIGGKDFSYICVTYTSNKPIVTCAPNS
jgi:hypothetical protein